MPRSARNGQGTIEMLSDYSDDSQLQCLSSAVPILLLVQPVCAFKVST